MNKTISKIILMVVAALSFFVSSQANALFHDENWGYYFKNQNTHEIKKTNIEWDMWNGFFDETQNRKLKPEEIPQKSYFENWDVVGYYHINRHINIQCKWNDGAVVISNLADSHSGDNNGRLFCKNIIQSYQDMGVNDLSFFDYWKYIFDLVVFMGLSIILGSIFDFLVLPVFYLFKYLRIKKPINVIYTLWIACFLGEIFSVYAGFSRMQLSGSLLGPILIGFFSVMVSPFYIWGIVIFFTKFVIIKWNIVNRNFINDLIINISILALGLGFFVVYNLGTIYSMLASQIGIALFVVVIAFIIRYQEKINAHMEKNFYPAIVPPK